MFSQFPVSFIWTSCLRSKSFYFSFFYVTYFTFPSLRTLKDMRCYSHTLMPPLFIPVLFFHFFFFTTSSFFSFSCNNLVPFHWFWNRLFIHIITNNLTKIFLRDYDILVWWWKHQRSLALFSFQFGKQKRHKQIILK